MDDGEITKEFRIETNDNLDRLDRELGLLKRRPKDAALQAHSETSRRLNPPQPIGVVWKMLPRVVRDLPAQSGRQVIPETDAAEIALDKTIIEAPEARIRGGKAAPGRFHEGGDGNGIDAERVMAAAVGQVLIGAERMSKRELAKIPVSAVRSGPR